MVLLLQTDCQVARSMIILLRPPDHHPAVRLFFFPVSFVLIRVPYVKSSVEPGKRGLWKRVVPNPSSRLVAWLLFWGGGSGGAGYLERDGGFWILSPTFCCSHVHIYMWLRDLDWNRHTSCIPSRLSVVYSYSHVVRGWVSVLAQS